MKKRSAYAMKNMQEMKSLNCQRYCVGNGSGTSHQMWVVGAAIVLLTTIIFTVNAEQSRVQYNNDEPSATHFNADDNLQQVRIYCTIYICKDVFKLLIYIFPNSKKYFHCTNVAILFCWFWKIHVQEHEFEV